MTYEELNSVRTLKKKITKCNEKLNALRECAKPASVKYTRDKVKNKAGKIESYTCLDVQPKSKNTTSPTETLAILITDLEKELSDLQEKLVETIPTLTKKIQIEVPDNTEQTLIIYRYLACEYFRDIGFKMGYSETWVYWKHNSILKKIIVDCS